MTRPTAAARRAEIETLAREYDDEAWRLLFERVEESGGDPLDMDAELLAYLDSVEAARYLNDGDNDCTPLGRAVAYRERDRHRRAKEQGHA